MNYKNERIRKLWGRGIRDVPRLAQKTGLSEERVREGLVYMELKEEMDGSQAVRDPGSGHVHPGDGH